MESGVKKGIGFFTYEFDQGEMPTILKTFLKIVSRSQKTTFLTVVLRVLERYTFMTDEIIR